jgi:hypothetical protein
MTTRQETVTVVTLMLLVSLAVMRPADAQVPTAADHAACNGEARQGDKSGAASPTPADRARADRATRAAVGNSPDFTAKGVESSDPQTHGIEAEGARRATYQAAYRSCMRRRGF